MAPGAYTFTMSCGLDMPGFDSLAFRAYALNDCLRACARHNDIAKPKGAADLQSMTACRAVVFSTDMPFYLYANCWLKNRTGALTPLSVSVDAEKRGPVVVGTLTGYS